MKFEDITIDIDTSVSDETMTIPVITEPVVYTIKNKGNGMLIVEHNELSIPVMPNYIISLACSGSHKSVYCGDEVLYFDEIDIIQ